MFFKVLTVKADACLLYYLYRRRVVQYNDVVTLTLDIKFYFIYYRQNYCINLDVIV